MFLERSQQQSHPEIRWRFERMPSTEKKKLISILRGLSQLDQEIADLHVFLPVVEVRFYGLGDDMLQATSMSPDTLLALLCDHNHPQMQRRES